jgi:hypothetical protein
VHKLPQPDVLEWTAEEAEGLDQQDSTHTRQAGTRICASYINYYAGNSSIVVPLFGDRNDQVAMATLAELFRSTRSSASKTPGKSSSVAATSRASPCRNTPARQTSRGVMMGLHKLTQALLLVLALCVQAADTANRWSICTSGASTWPRTR